MTPVPPLLRESLRLVPPQVRVMVLVDAFYEAHWPAEWKALKAKLEKSE